MRFGNYLRDSMNEAWYQYYLRYDELSESIKNLIVKQTESSEKEFIENIRSEYKKCNAFYLQKIEELTQELKQNDDTKYLMHQITELYQYGILNRIGFYKILKKHDKVSKISCLTYYSVKLSSDLFCPIDKINVLFAVFSKKHREVRKKILIGSPHDVRFSYLETEPPTEVYQKLISGELDEALQGDNFVRKSEKFWILLKDLPEIISIILKKLPMHLFNEAELIQETTSIYLDNDGLTSYHNRINKQEGADLIRLRWYGDLKNSKKIFIEQKVHHEDWTTESSSKDRFQMNKESIYDFLSNKGHYYVSDGTSLELVEKIKSSIDANNLRPYLATQYLRFAFQDEHNDFIRISIDTNLRMIKKTGDINEWSNCDTVVSSDNIHFFPYAVMEIKLREPFIENKPMWLTELCEKKEIIPVPDFSKYQHGCALLHSDRVDVVPYWVKNDIFIRKGGMESINRIQRLSTAINYKLEKPLPEVKISPQIVYANERSFYHWLSLGFVFYRTTFGNKLNMTIKMIMLLASVWSTINGCYLYYSRKIKLERGETANFHNGYGLYGIAMTIMLLAMSELFIFFY